MSASSVETRFTSTLSDSEFSPAPKENWSSSVLSATGYFAGKEVSATAFASQILADHGSYGRSRGKEFAARLDEASSRKEGGQEALSPARWIDRTIQFFLPGAFITGRCVVAGLAIIDEATRGVLAADEFLATLVAEEQEGRDSVEKRLTPEARNKLLALLRPAFSGSTATISDLPETSAEKDGLGRRAFADALAERIRSLRRTQPSSPLVILLDGPWGSGKSTVLNFVKESLGKDQRSRERNGSQLSQKTPWLVVEYNAWQQQELDRPWWVLSTLISTQAAQRFSEELDGGKAFRIRLHHLWFRTFSGRLPIFVAGVATAIVGIIFWLHPIGDAHPDVKDLLSLITVGFGVFLAAGRFLTATDVSAQEYLQSRADPIRALKDHTAALLKLIGRPVIVMVDDIDRCQPVSIGRLLEGIHTAFGDLPIVFLIAGDSRWVGRAFERRYQEMDLGNSAYATFGRPLGSLFLEKIFQFTATIPDIPPARKAEFWKHLLRIGEQKVDSNPEDAKAQLAHLNTEEEILRAVGEVDPAKEPQKAQHLREAAIRRLVEPDLIENPSHHVLQLFVDFIESNPRAMKRQIMAYGMARATDLASFRDTPQPLLAAWSVLCMRWPALADWLREDPLRLSMTNATPEAANATDKAFFLLLRSSEVQRLISGDGGLPNLDSEALLEMTGQKTFRETA